jgi:hypothetical protein
LFSSRPKTLKKCEKYIEIGGFGESEVITEIHERRKEKDLIIVAKNHFAFATALLWH